MKRRSLLKAALLGPLAPQVKWLAEHLPAPVRRAIRLDELVAATMRNRSRQIAENITNNNALLRMLEKKNGN